MPNWCANRVIVTGSETAISAITQLMQGECYPYYAKAIKQSIKLFVAGCAGVLKKTKEFHYRHYYLLTLAKIGEDNVENRAFTEWLCMLDENIPLTEKACTRINELYVQSGLGLLSWASLPDMAKNIIADLFIKKGHDWGNVSSSPDVFWASLEEEPEKLPFDMLLIKPTYLGNELNGFNGNFLYDIGSAYAHYVYAYDVNWPYGAGVSIDSGNNWMSADFDTLWSPPKVEIMSLLSECYECDITHYYCVQERGYCGYAVYKKGDLIEFNSDRLEYGDEDEDGYSKVIEPSYIIDNMAHFGG
ncbi:DUF1281 domain-containing protein (plasmid) [Xenorhabdus stockiae]|uniref:DUF1281 domain-containing protein n=1 Tax=Xenorhabdus stockiae TaxID=351614 RepID=UPI003CE703EA